MDHLTQMSDEQLVSAIKPLLVSDNYDYYLEYLRREQMKQVRVGMNAIDPVDIYRAQGQSSAFSTLMALKQRLTEASK